MLADPSREEQQSQHQPDKSTDQVGVKVLYVALPEIKNFLGNPPEGADNTGNQKSPPRGPETKQYGKKKANACMLDFILSHAHCPFLSFSGSTQRIKPIDFPDDRQKWHFVPVSLHLLDQNIGARKYHTLVIVDSDLQREIFAGFVLAVFAVLHAIAGDHQFSVQDVIDADLIAVKNFRVFGKV
jgi:hypothetical protein